MKHPVLEGRIGLALGSGAARGWAHVGVIRALEERGIVPHIVCGTSSGALVGALYAAGRLSHLEAWGRQLDFRGVLSYFDISLRGGLIRARKLVDFLAADLPDRDIQSLPIPFAAVATDLESGREIWLREGSLIDSLRASIAIPGLVTPVRLEGRWLADGALVNPVPVSLCRALGADSVIAVDLNTTLLRRRIDDPESVPLVSVVAPEPAEAQQVPVEDVAARAGGEAAEGAPPGAVAEDAGALVELEALALRDPEELPAAETDASTARRVAAAVQDFLADLRRRMAAPSAAPAEPRHDPPSIFETMANALNVMSVRITRSRMAGDPPDLLITPRLFDFALLDFHRAQEAIEEGRRAVAQALSVGSPDDLAG